MAKNYAKERVLEEKSKRACGSVNKTIHMITNEPSMGLYRIQQHIRKSMPKCVACHKVMEENDSHLKLMVYDANQAGNVLKDMQKTNETFDRIEEVLKKAVSSAAILNINEKSVLGE